MKKFRKTEDGLFICEECNKTFVKKFSLSNHLFYSHKNISKKEYFDKWLKDENDGKCIICGNETKFISLVGYKTCCSAQCGYDYNHIQIDKAVLEKYGVSNISKIPEIKIKKEKTCLKNHGVKAGFADVEKRKITINKKYGCDNVFQNEEIKEKCKQAHLKNLGVEYPLQSQFAKDKFKFTCIKKFGVENPSQNKEIFEKGQKTRLNLKQYKNTKIYYRGSYEFDFLENFYDNHSDIQNAKGIKYEFEGKSRMYFPDFYIPSLNLIIECKNSYLYERYKENIDIKEKATIASGFNYIMILDKKYDDLYNIVL